MLLSQRKTVSVNYIGFWDGFDSTKYRISKIIHDRYDVEITNRPQYLICSLFNYHRSVCEEADVKIFITPENMVPDFNLFDYCLGFDELSFGDRYLRVPNYILNLKYEEALDRMQNKHLYRIESDRDGFCSYIVSNGNGATMRDEIPDVISQYKSVDFGGGYRNNIGRGIGNTCKDKLEFQKQYKFALAIENTSHPGYTTEKLIEAFAAGCIPIYWGDPDVGKYFNTKSFINVMDYASLDDVVAEIIHIDEDEELYRRYISEPALIDKNYISNTIEELSGFIESIFDQPLSTARRRTSGVWYSQMHEIAMKGTSGDKKKAGGFVGRFRKK